MGELILSRHVGLRRSAALHPLTQLLPNPSSPHGGCRVPAESAKDSGEDEHASHLVFSWGLNNVGQLGTVDTLDRRKPALVRSPALTPLRPCIPLAVTRAHLSCSLSTRCACPLTLCSPLTPQQTLFHGMRSAGQLTGLGAGYGRCPC